MYILHIFFKQKHRQGLRNKSLLKHHKKKQVVDSDHVRQLKSDVQTLKKGNTHSKA